LRLYNVTPLGYALLGLVWQEPRSGYALRMVFQTTPMGNYSSSPGSIYPALERLRKAGFVETRGPGRGKGQYHITSRGDEVLQAWLAQPVDAADLQMALLRFAFLQFHPDRKRTRAFLDSFEAAALAQVEMLRQFLASEAGRNLSLQSRVAVEHGRRTYSASAKWAGWARLQFDKEAKEGR
jgi:DNA-binding PadR family transcriptional regulator